MTTLPVNLGAQSYEIHIGNDLLNHADRFLSLDRRVLILTDDGVPQDYAKRLAALCREPYIVTLPMGEPSKSLSSLSFVCDTMLRHNFTRSDCLCAIGGGVVGDLGGFCASCYMRGIDFYNLPTTVLSQIDSSVGGKTAVNFGSVKNILGSFYQPKAVIADLDLLDSLTDRQKANGFAEAVKMALTFDAGLFSRFEQELPFVCPEPLIAGSVNIKIGVVEKDVREKGLRRVLNFGHTLGHGIEVQNLGFLHGECVGMGMLPFCAEPVRKRLLSVLQKLGLPTACSFDRESVMAAVAHDKKAGEDGITVICCDKVGTFRTEILSLDDLNRRLAVISE